MSRGVKKVIRVTVIILLSLTLLVLAASWFVNRKIEERVYAEIENINTTLLGRYSISVGEVSSEILSTRLELKNITISTDSTLWIYGFPRVKGNLESIQLKGTGLFSTYSGKNLHLSSLNISNSNIEYFSGAKEVEETDTAKKLLYEYLPDGVRSLKIDDLKFSGSKIHFVDESKDTDLFVSNMNIRVTNMWLDSAYRERKKTFAYADEIFLSTGNVKYIINGERKSVFLEDLNLNTEEKRAEVSGLEVKDLTKRKELAMLKKKESVWIATRVNRISLDDFHFDKLVDAKQFQCRTLNVTDGEVEVFQDKSFPRDPKLRPPDLQKFLRESATALFIDSIIVKNVNVNYSLQTELYKNGSLGFNRCNAVFTGIRSDRKGNVQVKANCRLNKKIPMNLHLKFPLNSTNGQFNCSGNVGEFSFGDLRSITTVLPSMNLDGKVDKFRFSFNANNSISNGKLDMIYSDLRFVVLDKTNRAGRFRSFLLKPLYRESNPESDGDYNIGAISERRNPNRSFFNYFWISLRSGMFSVFGIENLINTQNKFAERRK